MAHQAGFESVVRARPRSEGGSPGAARRRTAASPPGPSTVLRKSWWSYWRWTHDGSDSRAQTSSPQSAGAGREPGSSAARAPWSVGCGHGPVVERGVLAQGDGGYVAEHLAVEAVENAQPARFPRGGSVTRPTTAERTSQRRHTSSTRPGRRARRWPASAPGSRRSSPRRRPYPVHVGERRRRRRPSPPRPGPRSRTWRTPARPPPGPGCPPPTWRPAISRQASMSRFSS